MHSQLDNVNLNGMGVAFSSFYRSSAVTPFITLYLIFSFVCIILTVIEVKFGLVWVIGTCLILFTFIITLIRNPDVMRSEDYNLEVKKISLGDKDSGLISATVIEPQQPVGLIKKGNSK